MSFNSIDVTLSSGPCTNRRPFLISNNSDSNLPEGHLKFKTFASQPETFKSQQGSKTSERSVNQTPCARTKQEIKDQISSIKAHKKIMYGVATKIASIHHKIKYKVQKIEDSKVYVLNTATKAEKKDGLKCKSNVSLSTEASISPNMRKF
jgi:hypothetical protein